MLKGVYDSEKEGIAMLYAVERFIQQDLEISPRSFYQVSYWRPSEVQQWSRKHTDIQLLPVGLLMDLAELSREGWNLQRTLTQLLKYQKEYYQQLVKGEEDYPRLLNSHHFIEDAKGLILPDGRNVLVRSLLNHLDDEVYQGPYQVLKGLNDQHIRQTIAAEKSGGLKTIGFDFRVQMVHNESTYPLAYYRYIGRSKMMH